MTDLSDGDTLVASRDLRCMSAGVSAGLWQRLLLGTLAGLQHGRLVLRLPGGSEILAAGNAGRDLLADMTIIDPAAARRIILGGARGFAESYIGDEWRSQDLVSLLRLALRNEKSVEENLTAASFTRLLDRLYHRLHANTRRGSRRNIRFHYDLGNEFYRRWLDAGMQYSSALYRTGEETLEEAQAAKLERIADLLELTGGQSVLEVGCGWGAMAEHLTRHHGCSVTGLTLSTEQMHWSKQRLTALRPEAGAEIRLQDYRDAEGVYDRVVSIEMLEAVGEENWGLYFRRLHDWLRPGGVAVIQVITIADSRFASYRRGADFIQRYIFPGGMLPCDAILRRQFSKAGLILSANQTFGSSYARTLAEWQARFHTAWPEIAMLGFDQRFKRMWEFYLSYCEAGFREGSIDVALYQLRKP